MFEKKYNIKKYPFQPKPGRILNLCLGRANKGINRLSVYKNQEKRNKEKVMGNKMNTNDAGGCKCGNTFPLIGDKAPEFRAMTTKGKVDFPEDYSGKWVVLFSHPADFTPVCTTEFIALAKAIEEFRSINTELLGLSIDSLHSHLAWVDSIKDIDWQDSGKVEVPFPVIADISMNVAKKYGMLQTVANTQTVRAVFIIDPEGTVRTILYYPMSTGRNISEIIRIIRSLQKHDSDDVSTPANWEPGDDVLAGAPLTLEAANEMMASNNEHFKSLAWYLHVKKENK